MPLSTLKLQFLFLQFSTQAMLMSSTCPLNNFLDQMKLQESLKVQNRNLHKVSPYVARENFEINKEIICPPPQV